MKSTVNYQNFDALAVSLQGSNLIEASAGTGKTYSIAILALRFVVERGIPIKEILMVTFTKAAVAELQARIRLFIRTAYKASTGVTIGDKNIARLVQGAAEASSADEVCQRLRDAVLFLDETSVLTIHSFCQNTLFELAFETGQQFGAELLTDMTPLLDEQLNAFWRRHVTTLPLEILHLIDCTSLRDGLRQAIQEHLAGKKYAGFDEGQTYTLGEGDCVAYLERHGVTVQEVDALVEALYQRFVAERSVWEDRCGKGNAKRYLAHLLDDPEAFLNAIRTKRNAAYVSEGFADLLEALDECDEKTGECEDIVRELKTRLYCFAIQEVTRGIGYVKQRANVIGYDDLIGNLHSALVPGPNPALIGALRKKYKAVFIDEFQDTDRQQYRIFQTAFGGKDSDTVLFYIGDPKQSIYAWRKADVFTYFEARDGVDSCYGMNTNYRSTAPMVDAMNKFFRPQEDFDTFGFEDSENTISYIPVDSGSDKGLCFKNGSEEPPVSLFSCETKDAIVDAVAAQVAQLLKPGTYTTGSADAEEQVLPADIGILVRTSAQGRDVKAVLAAAGIPAITIDDTKVMQTVEAQAMRYLLEAMASPDRSTVNRALLSPFTDFVAGDVLRLDDEAALQRFLHYRNTWLQGGLYNALCNFDADFNMQQRLLSTPDGAGERILANFYQLTELLHSVQTRKGLSAPETIAWLDRGIERGVSGDEYEQRLEHDEAAVKIATIHASKGLEYKVVLAPFLDLVPHRGAVSKDLRFLNYRDPETRDYHTIEEARATEEQKGWHRQQEEQEHRRLLYVALTRAIYKCCIFRCESNYYKNSTLQKFLSALSVPDDRLIRNEKDEETLLAPAQVREGHELRVVGTPKVAHHFALQQAEWRRLSFTSLNVRGDHTVYPRASKGAEAYDNFVFADLKRGAKTGELLHYIFERVRFDTNSGWDTVLEDALRRFAPAQREAWLPMLRTMLHHVLNTTLQVGDASFVLSSVGWNRRIPEFEFDFPVSPFQATALSEILVGSGMDVRIRADRGKMLEGMMNGKMDLFFEQDGRYYILDWKSNYLGDSVMDYSSGALIKAMNEEGYHLQCYIYCLAAKKYLEHRERGFDYNRDFGGVFYLFLRGIRIGENTGIYTFKPPVATIDAVESLLGKPNKTLRDTVEMCSLKLANEIKDDVVASGIVGL